MARQVLSPFVVRIVLAGLLLGVGGAAYWWLSRDKPVPEPQTARFDHELAPDPRLTLETPFRNVHPSVKYVGDAACAGCHTEQDTTYHHHPMGRSATVDFRNSPLEKYDAGSKAAFAAFGNVSNYAIERRGDALIHKLEVKTPEGKTVAADEAEICLGIGSGTRGRSYLLHRGGVLNQSPASWFSEKSIWHPSPGYSPELQFSRRITGGCLACHIDRYEPVPERQQHVREPKFPKQVAIGCERCHGPGALHVEERTTAKPAEKIDYSIVNPKHLDQDLRDSICQQCHLQGELRVLRRDRGIFDFRPGLPFEHFMTVFTRPAKVMDFHKSVGQFDQMLVSRCRTQSGGALTCTSCHDPHYAPPPEKKAEHYRSKCQTCHQQKGCTETPALRTAKQDNCVTCHMPKGDSTSIVHASVTDHRVLRRTGLPEPPKAKLQPGEDPLVPFARTKYSPKGPELERDLAIALNQLAEQTFDNPAIRSFLNETATTRLREALSRFPGDVDLLVNAAQALAQKGPEKSLAYAQEALQRAPDDELALLFAAVALMNRNRDDEAVGYLTTLAGLTPSVAVVRRNLGEIALRQKKYDEAETQFRALIGFHPVNREGRIGLAAALEKRGRVAEAKTHLDFVAFYYPQLAADSARLFERLMK
jgi:Flp pilus assembly protein TadD